MAILLRNYKNIFPFNREWDERGIRKDRRAYNLSLPLSQVLSHLLAKSP